jgi:hypothetical protein
MMKPKKEKEMKKERMSNQTLCAEFVYRGPGFYEVEMANRVELMLSGGMPRVGLFDGEPIVSTDATAMQQRRKFREDHTPTHLSRRV